jgi:ribose transport system ATP-binding protein
VTAAEPSSAAAAPPLLAVHGICKSFPGVQVLRDVAFEIHSGEVVALVGENGAGKSTLMKILGGVHRQDQGRVTMSHEEVEFADPAAALRHGVALIYQELDLCDNLSVEGVLFLGRELVRGPFLDRAAMRRGAEQALQRVGLDVDPATPVECLTTGQQQLVLIARALREHARVLIMDEPTSSLTMQEVERLFVLVRELKAQGVGIVYISHRLAEVEVLADRVVGLRDGQVSGELRRDQIGHDAMVALMVGRQLLASERTGHTAGADVLVVDKLATAAFEQAESSFVVRQCEIVGLAGLLGSGRSELLRAVCGADRRRRGRIEVDGQALGDHDPREAAAAGLVLVPEDRKLQGLLLDWSVEYNLSLPTLASRGRWLDRHYERDLVARSVAELSIATPSAEQLVSALSGGNQQKVVIGKWLAARPKVLVLDEPTRGVDVGARAEIYRRMDELAGSGMAVLFASSDLEEILAISDRVLVLREGGVVGELLRGELSEEAVMRLATGLGDKREAS